jgi:hypothetical protein
MDEKKPIACDIDSIIDLFKKNREYYYLGSTPNQQFFYHLELLSGFLTSINDTSPISIVHLQRVVIFYLQNSKGIDHKDVIMMLENITALSSVKDAYQDSISEWVDFYDGLAFGLENKLK